jgi:uncharacterized OB-fold protein
MVRSNPSINSGCKSLAEIGISLRICSACGKLLRTPRDKMCAACWTEFVQELSNGRRRGKIVACQLLPTLRRWRRTVSISIRDLQQQ